MASASRNRPARWSLEDLRKADLGRAAFWCDPAVLHAIGDLGDLPRLSDLEELSGPLDTLLAVGGGSLLDRAKHWRRHRAPDTRLVAVPSLWGSGAEASPVVVLNGEKAKEVHVDDGYLPDARLDLPGVADDLPMELARWGCGDCWSHALEGFLSPLACTELRADLAALIEDMLALGVRRDTGWFELSARASAGQARSSVGLVHGLAHALELPARKCLDPPHPGHARLCATFLLPVMRFNRQHGAKLDELFDSHALDLEAVFAVMKDLHEEELYARLRPLVEANWKTILRDPCSRTNCTLVRPGHLSFFFEGAAR